MVTYGPWMDDSVPVWRTLNNQHTHNTWGINHSSDAGVDSGGWAAAAGYAWNGTGGTEASRGGLITTEAPSSALMRFQGIEPGGVATWIQAWHTLTRADPPTATVGQLPGPSDPNAIGVDWEPTDVVVDETLTFMLGDSSTRYSVDPAAPLVTFKRAADMSFRTAGMIAGLPTLAQLTAPPGDTAPEVTFTPPATTLIVTAVDSWTLGQVVPAEHGDDSRQQALPYTWTWKASFTPRYRYVYADAGRMPPLRQVQRPSVPRAVQNNSRQASLRSGRAFI